MSADDQWRDPHSLASAALGRAMRIQRLTKALADANRHDIGRRLGAHNVRLLDQVDADLERCAVRLERLAERAGVL